MTDKSPPYWFPAKSYGFGWGLPITWQGWLVFLGAWRCLPAAHSCSRHSNCCSPISSMKWWCRAIDFHLLAEGRAAALALGQEEIIIWPRVPGTRIIGPLPQGGKR